MASRIVNIKCHGRNKNGWSVLKKAEEVTVVLTKRPGSDIICVGVTDCPHNTGGHGQRCMASHHEMKDILCPYSFDLPFAKEIPGWTVPPRLRKAVGELEEVKE